MTIHSKIKLKKSQKFWNITHNPKYTKLVFVYSNQGLVYNQANPTHSTLFSDFANQISSLFIDGRVAEYNGKSVVQFYGLTNSFTLVERELIKSCLQELLSLGYVTVNSYAIDGADNVLGIVESLT